MANKDLKTRTPISNAVDTKLLEQLKNYSNNTESIFQKKTLINTYLERLMKTIFRVFQLAITVLTAGSKDIGVRRFFTALI